MKDTVVGGAIGTGDLVHRRRGAVGLQQLLQAGLGVTEVLAQLRLVEQGLEVGDDEVVRGLPAAGEEDGADERLDDIGQQGVLLAPPVLSSPRPSNR